MKLIDEKTLLLVFGDHGMTDIGDHGGDSKLEVETLLFLYSKKSFFKSVNKIFIIKSHVKAEVAKEGYNFFIFLKKTNEITSVKQIDLTPTLALLLGIPIPFSNLGIVILDTFKNMEFEALNANFIQVSLKNVFFFFNFKINIFPSLKISSPSINTRVNMKNQSILMKLHLILITE